MSLFSWYKENSINQESRLFDLTMGMLGNVGSASDCEKEAHPGCEASLKAMETQLLAKWVVHELKTIGDGVPFRDDLVTAGLQAISFWHLLHNLPDVIPMQQCQILCDHMQSFIVHYSRAGLAETTKLHVLMHLAQRTIIATWSIID